ncbi:dTDP-4-dehydrorhamnose reductase [Arenibacter sp. GZD96]|uniref:dTDP-4-dehydrorhamnose reductase n=1 Tax=Aurantibrevibacter litoralis TaxID=3106030 RepID=UPI002AFF9DD8|nr:dTDP-4-dehydrorhamnose reductase [Arenibacter sp. GZD-96]MEA1786450.1 dTDP-4-dehydrorhamnose reductase [Arenibacter sp. GZD-96]
MERSKDMKRILVTGASGQLGLSIRDIAPEYRGFEFHFVDYKALDITDYKKVYQILQTGKFHYCINCAAFTNVEQAEVTPEIAFQVNAEAVQNLALACKDHNVLLVHISTDYVFDGEKDTPYTTTDLPNPLNEYGKSKWEGEKHIAEILNNYFIVRTSWLYSNYGKNFYTTILEKAKRGETLRITDEQTGCPTHAGNLATFILELILSESQQFGIYHFTDGEAMTWYEFASKIIETNNLKNTTKIVRNNNYRSFAKRPRNSVLANLVNTKK